MRTLPILKAPWAYLLALVFSLAFVFWWNQADLHQPFQEDDFGFLRVPLGRYSVSAKPTGAGFADVIEAWNPNHGWFYRPTYLTYWLGMHGLGLTRPPLMHAIGVLVHGLIAFLWAMLLVRLSRRVWWGVAAWVAFVFWPGGEQAVTWIASHSTLFAVLGVLGAAHFWVYFREGRGQAFRWLSVAALWLGCCAKNDAAAGIVLFPLLDYVLGAGALRLSERLRDYAPLLAAWALYMVCEFHGARLYGIYGDHVYDIMAHVSFFERFRFVLSWTNAFTHGVPPIYPFSVLSLLVVPFALVCRRLWLFWREQLTEREARTIGLVTLFSVAVAIPIPFVSCFHAMGSRFLYFPALPFAALVAMALAGAGSAALRWERSNSDSALSLGAVTLAALLISIVWRPIVEPSDPAVSAMLHLGILGTLFVLVRASALDLRIAATLAVSLLARDGALYAPFNSIDVWPAMACVAGLLIWRRDALGALLAFAASINFPVVVLLLGARWIGAHLQSKTFEHLESEFSFEWPLPSANRNSEPTLS